MSIFENRNLNLLALPNEVLLIIFDKLNMIDVLYSLVGINERLDQLVLHPLYIRHLNVTSMTGTSVSDRAFPMDGRVLDRVCQDILPRIYDQVDQLTVEEQSMERILETINYPDLRSLSLVNFSRKTLDRYLTGK